MSEAIASGRIVCPSNSGHSFNGNETLTITVADRSLMDGPSFTLGEEIVKLSAGQSFPISFKVTYDESRVGRGHGGRSISVAITDENNKVLFWSPIRTDAAEGIDLTVE